MKKITTILMVLALGATFTCVSCKKGDDPQVKEIAKIVKWGNRTFTYDDQAKLTQIAEYEGENYSKCLFEYNGNTVNIMDEEQWGDWHQDPKLVYVLTLNADGYITAMTVKKDAGDIEYTFTYTNGFLTAGALKDGTQLFTRTISDENVASWIQCRRYFEYGEYWDQAPVDNAKQTFTFGSAANVGGFPVDMIDYRRNPDNGDLKIEKMFLQAGLFGKASKLLPTKAVWTNADGSALPETYYETETDYFYQYDADNHVIGLSNDGENYTEIVWEKITLK